MSQKNDNCQFEEWSTVNQEKTFELNGTSGIREVATNEANLDRPKPNDTSPTVAENEIYAKGKNYCDALKSKARKCFQDLETRASELKSKLRGSEMARETSDTIAECDGDLVNLENSWKNHVEKIRLDIESLKERYISYTREVDAFKQTHNIPRQADSASLKEVLIVILVTLFAFMFEVKINGTAVGSVSIGGQNYGVLIAVIVASINVIASAFVGYTCVKHVNDVEIKSRRKYIILSYAYGIVVIYLNWAYAAFRESSEILQKAVLAKQIDRREAMTQSLTEASTPWEVALSLPSVGLFLLGLFFAGFAIYKYYHLNDTIPGYGTISRLKKNAEDIINNSEKKKADEKQDRRKSTTEKITKRIEGAKSKIKDVMKKSNEALQEYNNLIDTAQQKKTNFITNIDQCNDGVNHMMLEFRKTNSTIQLSKNDSWKQPNYWSDKISLRLEDYDPEEVFKDQKPIILDDIEKSVHLKKISEKIETNYTENYEKLTTYQKNIFGKIDEALK